MRLRFLHGWGAWLALFLFVPEGLIFLRGRPEGEAVRVRGWWVVEIRALADGV